MAAFLRAEGFDVGISNSQDSLAGSLILPNGKRTWIFFMRKTSGRLETSLQNLSAVDGYRDEDSRREVLERIRALPIQSVRATAKLNGWPSFALEELRNPSHMSAFEGLVLEVREQILNANPGKNAPHIADGVRF